MVGTNIGNFDTLGATGSDGAFAKYRFNLLTHLRFR